MQVENPIRLVRELKGAPISIILVLSFSTLRVTQEWLERATGYTDKPVSQALQYLAEIGLVDHTRSGWQLTGEAAISRPALLANLKALGFEVHERAARAMINQLRKDGHLICSTGGNDGGYWLASSWEELGEYLEHEVHPRAMDMLEQEQALRKAGERAWGPASMQGKLF